MYSSYYGNRAPTLGVAVFQVIYLILSWSNVVRNPEGDFTLILIIFNRIGAEWREAEETDHLWKLTAFSNG